MGFTAATETAFPALMKLLMDKGFSRGSGFQIWWVPAGVIGLFLLRGLAAFVASYTMQWVSNNVLRDIRIAMFDKLLLMPSKSFDSKSGGKLLSRLVSDTQMVLYAATSVLTVLVRDSLILLGLLTWLVWLNWKLTMVVVAVMPALGFLTYKFSKRMRRVSRDYLDTIGSMTSVLEEVISGNRVIKIQQAQRYEKKRFFKVVSEQRAQSMKYSVAASLHSPTTQLIAAFGLAIVLTISLNEARTGRASIGDFVSYITAMLMMLGPLKHLADVNAQLQRGLAAAENVFQVVDETPESDTGTHSVDKVRGHIEFCGVSVRYETRESAALKNINLEILPGQAYAFVGPSGGGKTTLVNVLPRLYEISSGEVRLDGVDLRGYTLASLRSQIALVSQDVVLFNDTIEKNITYGIDGVSEEKLNKAIEAADLVALIASLPQGLDTVLGDRGVRISGGQRQRIAIARAVLKDAPILILDEATSALDTKTEENVQNALNNLRRNRTTLIVAHRLSTVINADRIVVLKDGEVIEQGTHSQLLDSRGIYFALYSKLDNT